jgi:histidinol dehydrogenase
MGDAMMKTIDLRSRPSSRAELAGVVPRAGMDVATASGIAQELIDDVRTRGEIALLDQAERLDGVRPPRVRIHADEVSAAVRSLDACGRRSMRRSHGCAPHPRHRYRRAA